MLVVTRQAIKMFLLNVIAAGGGVAAITWFVFAKFGDSWFAKRFAKQLETHKHELASLFSRISKIHEKEFEILPTTWLKLHQAYGRISGIRRALKTFPDLKQMDPALFEAFVDACNLHEVHKKKLYQMPASDRDDYYRQWLFWTELSEAKSAQEDLNNYLVTN